MRALITICFAAALAACGHTQIVYTPVPPSGMTDKQAASIVEQGFYEDYGQEKPQTAMVTAEYVALSNGSISRGVNLGTASAYNGVVAGIGSTFMRTEEINQRIYFRSVGDLLVARRNGRANRYAVTIRTTDGTTARHVFFRSEQRAKEFADAMEFLKRGRSGRTPAVQPASAGAPMGEQAYRDQQLQQLMQQNLPYEEYMRRYRQIMAE